MLLEAARRTPGLMTDRPPFVFHCSWGLLRHLRAERVLQRPVADAGCLPDLHRHILDVFTNMACRS